MMGLARSASKSCGLDRPSTAENLVSHVGAKAELRATGGAPSTSTWRILPPEEHIYDAAFFKQLFDRAKMCGYMKGDSGIHVSSFRTFCRRMSDALDLERIVFDPQEVFDPRRMTYMSSAYVSWADMRHAMEYLDDSGCPALDARVQLNLFERINMVFSGRATSALGFLWSCVLNALIVLTCFYVLMPELPKYGIRVPICVFTVDYVVRLFCSPFVRTVVSDRDRLVMVAVPDPKDMRMPQRKTRLQRLSEFVISPMGIVDFVAILPFWIHVLAFHFPLNLSFVRAVRIVRSVQTLQLGGFTDMLAILGETMYRSRKALMVMSIWIVIISLVLGPSMKLLGDDHGKDDEPWSFDTVPASFLWVVGRLCNMHGSVQEKSHVPHNLLSNLIVIFVGICRGCMLLAPVGQIAAEFNVANGEFRRKKEIQDEILREKVVFLGTEWNRDPRAPLVAVDLLNADDDSPAGVGTFNLPILEARTVTTTVAVPINSRITQGICHRACPMVRVQIEWTPEDGYRDAKLGIDKSKFLLEGRHHSDEAAMRELPWTEREPEGWLLLQIVDGEGFGGGADARWKCRLRVPVGLHGPGAMAELVTEPSYRGAPCPAWDGAGEVFKIDWSASSGHESGGAAQLSSATDWMKIRTFKKQVIDLLYERADRIRALEATLQAEGPRG